MENLHNQARMNNFLLVESVVFLNSLIVVHPKFVKLLIFQVS